MDTKAFTILRTYAARAPASNVGPGSKAWANRASRPNPSATRLAISKPSVMFRWSVDTRFSLPGRMDIALEFMISNICAKFVLAKNMRGENKTRRGRQPLQYLLGDRIDRHHISTSHLDSAIASHRTDWLGVRAARLRRRSLRRAPRPRGNDGGDTERRCRACGSVCRALARECRSR